MPKASGRSVADSAPTTPAVGVGADFSDPDGFVHVPHAQGRLRRRPVRDLFVPAPGRESVLTAAIAVGALIVVKFAVALVQLLGNAVAFDPASYSSGFDRSPIGLFLGAVVTFPFPFYLGAFAALVLGFPILRRSPLSVILGRAVAAGTVGTILLAVAGLAFGVGPAVRSGGWVDLLLDVLFVPLSSGITLTAVLVASSVAGWLWLGREEPLLRAQDATSAAGATAPVAAVADAPTEPSGRVPEAVVPASVPSPVEAVEAVETAAPRAGSARTARARSGSGADGARSDEADWSRYAPPR